MTIIGSIMTMTQDQNCMYVRWIIEYHKSIKMIPMENPKENGNCSDVVTMLNSIWFTTEELNLVSTHQVQDMKVF